MNTKNVATFSKNGYEFDVVYIVDMGHYSLYNDEGECVSGSFDQIDEMFDWADDYINFCEAEGVTRYDEP